MSLRPRALAYRGRVSAHAFLLRVGHIGEAEARRRALALWTPGGEIYRLGTDLLVVLPEPREVEADRALGWPLVPLPGRPRILSAAPLSEREIGQLESRHAAVLLVDGGELREEALSPDRREDPAGWLDLDGWTRLDASPLGAERVIISEALDPVEFDPRRRLAGVPEPHPEMARVLAALRGERPGPGEQAPSRSASSTGGWLAGLLASGTSWLRQMLAGRGEVGAETRSQPESRGGFDASSLEARWLAPFLWLLGSLRLLGGLFGAQSGGAATEGGASGSRRTPAGGGSGTPAPPKRSPWDALRDLAARLAMRSHLGRLIGRRQEQYLARMMELFERGDLLDALRYAIPLGGSGQGSAPPALGVPTPRDSLQLNPVLSAGGSALHAVPDLFEHLQRLYRAAFERLRDQGKIDEAAFVLAELLHADEEAVAFLERHGRLRLAAEMAEGRKLPPGLVVRQWWLAGDRERAVQLARRDQAWTDALIRLDPSHPEQAQQLRVTWGSLLAGAGDYAQAVEVVWPIPEARHLARNWIEQVLQQGGVAAARMLPRKLKLAPETAGEVRSAVADLLEQEGAEAAWARRALAEALRTGEKTADYRLLARATARALARDLAAGAGPAQPEDVAKLVSFSGDGALRTDLPPLTSVARISLSERSEPTLFRPESGDAGVYPVHEAVYLSNGRCVVALGEAGVRLLSREGKSVAHFDQPAHRLVLSDHEDRVIAVAERGGVYRLAQIDLQNRTVRDWAEAELTAFADTFDGATWLVGTGQDFVSLDALSSRVQALWRTREVGLIEALHRRPNRASLLRVKEASTDALRPAETGTVDWERWMYDLPSLVLRHRQPLSWTAQDLGEKHCAVSPAGATAYVDWLYPDDPANVQFKLLVDGLEVTEDGHGPLILDPCGADAYPFRVALSEEWITVTRELTTGVDCWLASMSQRKVRAHFRLEGARHARARLQPEHLTLCDDRGRILVLELHHGQLIRDLRLR